MAKTALQEILDTLENDWLSPQPYINLINSYLEKEKNQIIQAYDLGSMEDMQYPDENVVNNGEEYFNTTYKT